MTAPSSPLAYIPPLIDGACGTVLRAEQPTMSLLRDDARVMMGMMTTMFTALWTELMCHARRMSWADMGDVLIHVGLAVMELHMVVAAVPLFLIMPGAVSALWCTACAMMIMGFARILNGKSRVIRCMAGSDGWMMGQEAEDEKWIYVGGMELSSRHLATMTLPSLSKLFSRSFIAIPMRTYGLPLDLLSALTQRNTHLPSDTTRILYTQLRSSLLDSSINRVVILSHNLGSLPVSKALSQLLSDLPADKLSKLEVYTFGAATSEFVLPTGEAPMSAPSSPSLTNGHHQQQPILERRPHRLPHVEHYALTSDPFAHIGVLRAAKETLETRFCGGVFVMAPPTLTTAATARTATTTSANTSQKAVAAKATLSARATVSATGLSLHTYLTALFPTQMTSSRHTPSVLDEVMLIDRDVAEKREFAAMSNFAALRSSAGGSPKDGKKERLSWTGLGATAGQKRDGSMSKVVMDGVAGLEMARKGCKDCDGHRGREVSWLVRYVNVGCVENGGFKVEGGRMDDGGMNGMVNGDHRME
ncbi:hypothetical protein CONLIGDRAFT_636786 [Coniochaeta ligniaria NRRL 30616]|uniref:Uncharacterized protein n=1 Tax=Coniochaeta ligniaria NRRL 30616 TaxID=1408157 RepID=A0A1J7J4B4_9PEZI|nr:hypothetical protein CONLIGDRAFT_636786 [Coniochaeta ligniaria NRRL 30616]